MHTNHDIGSQLNLWQKIMTVVTAFLFIFVLTVVVIGFVYSTNSRDQIADEARRTTDALCVLKVDLKGRVESSKAFLLSHPNGIPGISADDIQNSIDNQLSTIAALSIIKCSTPDQTVDERND